MTAFDLICTAEDAFTWVALLCGNHLGHFAAFWVA